MFLFHFVEIYFDVTELDTDYLSANLLVRLLFRVVLLVKIAFFLILII